jgi:hypothetical protein
MVIAKWKIFDRIKYAIIEERVSGLMTTDTIRYMLIRGEDIPANAAGEPVDESKNLLHGSYP